MAHTPDKTGSELRSALLDGSDHGLVRLAELHSQACRPNGVLDGKAVETTNFIWLREISEPDLGAALLAAVERSGALMGPMEPKPRVLVQDLVAALGTLRYEPARGMLEKLWSTSTVEAEVRARAGHALLAFGDDAALALVASRLTDARGVELVLVIQAVLQIKPGAAWDMLSPSFATPSERGGEVLDAIMDVLLRDCWDHNKPHWGASRGWFRADSRWLKLCEQWAELPDTESRQAWGVRHAQRIFEAAAWLRKNAYSALGQ